MLFLVMCLFVYRVNFNFQDINNEVCSVATGGQITLNKRDEEQQQSQIQNKTKNTIPHKQ